MVPPLRHPGIRCSNRAQERIKTWRRSQTVTRIRSTPCLVYNCIQVHDQSYCSPVPGRVENSDIFSKTTPTAGRGALSPANENKRNPHANQRHTDPTSPGDSFAEENLASKCARSVAQCCYRNHKTHILYREST